ncbi:MAG TPA: hypothetical protein VMZ11_06200 [Mycobacteriales bacterium]|nr:hypothetical protein [Mycobacteriales bacterium]
MLLRSALVGSVVGAVGLSAAWAGISVLPVPSPPVTSTATDLAHLGRVAVPGSKAAAAPARSASFLVGAAKSSIAPRPKDMAKRFPGARWETDPAECTTLDPHELQRLAGGHATEPLDGFASAGSPWPENPSCIYMGGFGIGPMNPVKKFDTVDGLWVRSMAISSGRKVLVLTVVEGEGWLWDYKSKCTDCGAKQIGQALAADPALKARGATPASFVLHATHSHSAPDFIGGWGFVPNWYMAQVTDTIKATAKRAVLAMERASLEVGEVEARPFNGERRDTYRAAEEQQLSWLRATSARTHRTIATLGAYAAHPTTRGTNNGVATPDWVGPFEHELEHRFGGMGLHMMTGLGNMSASGGTAIGKQLADLVPAAGHGRRVSPGPLRIAQQLITSPVTNVPLSALGTPGFFDRKMDPVPAAVSVGENPNAPCVSAAPTSVRIPVTVAKLSDDVELTFAPGEVFSNLTNTIKEKASDRVVFPIAQANDALGYQPQSFEINPVGQQGLGFVAGGYVFVNYEDSYAIDRCIGDSILETTLSMLNALK